MPRRPADDASSDDGDAPYSPSRTEVMSAVPNIMRKLIDKKHALSEREFALLRAAASQAGQNPHPPPLESPPPQPTPKPKRPAVPKLPQIRAFAVDPLSQLDAGEPSSTRSLPSTRAELLKARRNLVRARRDLWRGRTEDSVFLSLETKREAARRQRAERDARTHRPDVAPMKRAEVIALSILMNGRLAVPSQRLGSIAGVAAALSGAASARTAAVEMRSWTELFKVVDANGSGCLCYDELRQLVREPSWGLGLGELDVPEGQLQARRANIRRNSFGAIRRRNSAPRSDAATLRSLRRSGARSTGTAPGC